MTCPHCGFENVESNQVCFRCNQELDLSALNVDPPRRRGGALAGMRDRAAAGWQRRRDSPTRGRSEMQERMLPTVSAFISLVPGLGHLLLGQTRRAAVMAAVWAVVLGWTWWSDPPIETSGALLLAWFTQLHWGLTTTHAWIMADAYQQRVRRDGRRAEVFEVALVTVMAVGILCLPELTGDMQRWTEYALGYRHMRVGVSVDDPNVRMGDELLIQYHLTPGTPIGRGVVVVFARNTRWERADECSTVRGVAGDVVEWNQLEHQLKVNEEIQRDLPAWVTTTWAEMPDRRITLEPGQFLIMPVFAADGLEACVVSRQAIRGHIVRIEEPANRRRQLP